VRQHTFASQTMHRRRDFRERQIRHDDMLPDDGTP
jgi:hypothetical protein